MHVNVSNEASEAKRTPSCVALSPWRASRVCNHSRPLSDAAPFRNRFDGRLWTKDYSLSYHAIDIIVCAIEYTGAGGSRKLTIGWRTPEGRSAGSWTRRKQHCPRARLLQSRKIRREERRKRRLKVTTRLLRMACSRLQRTTIGYRQKRRHGSFGAEGSSRRVHMMWTSTMISRGRIRQYRP